MSPQVGGKSTQFAGFVLALGNWVMGRRSGCWKRGYLGRTCGWAERFAAALEGKQGGC